MRIPDHTLAEISDRLDMAAVVSDYVHLEKKGGRYWGLCPFHTEKTPSFTVDPEKSVFYCFGCHKGGSLFTFVMEIEKLSFPESVKLLAEKAGVELEVEAAGDGRRAAYLELYRRVAGSFHHLLLRNPEAAPARAYLQRRGLAEESWRAFQLGYAPANRRWLYRFLLEKSFSREFLAGSGLFTVRSAAGGREAQQPLSAFFWGRVVFPISNHRKEVIGFGGRSLKEEVRPKYLNSPESDLFRKRDTLYGGPGVYQLIRGAGSALLVEGYMDVLALWQAGVENCVAPLGTAVTAGQLRLLKRYAPRVVLLFDADEAGVRASERTILLCEREDLDVEVISLDRGKDPAEILEKDGAEALKERLKHRISSFQFYLNTARAKHDSRTPDGKRAVIRYLTPYLSSLDSQVRRDGYVRVLAEDLGVDFESVRNDLLRGTERFTKNGDSRRSAREGAAVQGMTAELFLLLAVAVNRRYFPELRNIVGVDDLEDKRARNVFVALEECYRLGETTEEALLQRLEDEQLRQLLLEKTASGEFTINPDRVIRDGLREVRRRSLEKRRKLLVGSLARSAERDPVKLKELLAEKMYLDGELQNLRKVIMDE